jgi:hypothetical protein
VTEVVADVARCANCAAHLTGEFCSQCGQRVRDLRRPFGQLLAEAVEHALNVDTRFARTLRPLLVTPGEVTRAYLAGRRVAFLPPLRTYLIAAVIFFGLFSIFPSAPINVAIVTRDSAEERELRRRSFQGTSFSVPAHLPMFDDAYQETLARARRDPQAFARNAYSVIPRLFFLYVPLFALYLELFYRRQGYYFEHLVFALYYHAALFVAFSAWFLVGRLGAPGFLTIPARLALAAWVIAYLPLALRRVYRGSWPATLLKVAALALIYLLTVLPLSGLLIVVWGVLTF